LVETAAEYRWSPAAAHVGLTEGLHGRVTASDWAARLGQGMERGELAAIRRATQTECPLLGEAGFVEQSEAKFQVRLRPPPPGPVARMGVQGERGLVESAGQAGRLA